jgi:hypothetical protein
VTATLINVDGFGRVKGHYETSENRFRSDATLSLLKIPFARGLILRRSEKHGAVDWTAAPCCSHGGAGRESNQSRAKKGCNARRVSEKYQRNHPVCSNSAADCELYDGPSD